MWIVWWDGPLASLEREISVVFVILSSGSTVAEAGLGSGAGGSGIDICLDRLGVEGRTQTIG